MTPESTVGAPVGVLVCDYGPCVRLGVPHFGSLFTHSSSYRLLLWSLAHTRGCQGNLQTPASPGCCHPVLIMTERKNIALFYCVSPLCVTWKTHLSKIYRDVRNLKMMVCWKLVNLLGLQCRLWNGMVGVGTWLSIIGGKIYTDLRPVLVPRKLLGTFALWGIFFSCLSAGRIWPAAL